MKTVKAFNLNDKVIAALEARAKKEDRSLSWLVNNILAKELLQA